jgi:D-alanyl-D-alanine carboxypeptidase
MLDSRYEARVAAIHRALDIAPDYGCEGHLPLQPEPTELVAIGTDVFGRVQRLAPAAAARWQTMQTAAARDGIALLVVSGFRSLDYQHELIRRKLARGQSIAEILTVNAAPGYSEHHTGLALDLASVDCEPLTETFEDTSAFAWLRDNAGRFDYALSYPRGNPQGFVYEPWHWALRRAGNR